MAGSGVSTASLCPAAVSFPSKVKVWMEKNQWEIEKYDQVWSLSANTGRNTNTVSFPHGRAMFTRSGDAARQQSEQRRGLKA